MRFLKEEFNIIQVVKLLLMGVIAIWAVIKVSQIISLLEQIVKKL